MLLLFTLLFLATSTAVFAAPAPVDSSTLDGKVIFGYQGWFMTPNDGGNVGYRHWSKDTNSMNPKTVNVDIWPDMTEYPADSFQSTDLVLPGSQAAPVFSSLNPGVMDLHFRWLYNYSLDGVFLQRFLGEVQDSRFFAIRNNVTTNMRAAAEKYNRTFAIMYDVTGMTDDGLLTKIQNDWKYLTGTLQVTQSPQYQKHNGKPVLTIWGLGFTHINISSAVALQVVSYFQSQGYYVIGGVPFAWRTSNQDSRPDFTSVYQQFDALSPWAVGRFDDSGVKSAFEVRVLDKTVSYARGQYYAPVLFPGFSWANMNAPNATLNQIPRLAGKFFTDQADGLVNTLLAKKTFLYLAMFDEMDEGTAFFKAAPNKNQVPVDPSFVTLDIDGTDLPSDYYLQLASNVTASFKKVSSFTSKTLLRA